MFNLLNLNKNNNKNEDKKPIRRLVSTIKPLDRKKNCTHISEKKKLIPQAGEKRCYVDGDGGENNSEKKIRPKKEEAHENKNKGSLTKREQIGKGNESQLDTFIDSLSSKTLHDLKLEYAAIKSYIFPEHTRNAFDHNMSLNKYKDIVCIDETRVTLEPPGTHYYHANFVTQLGMKNIFICCQAPMNETIVDFWRLCTQKNVQIIICLVNLIENGKQKCAQYWPTSEGETLKFKYFNVLYDSTDNCDEAFFIRNLKVWVNGAEDVPIKIKQIQWRNWPDKSVPPDTTSIMRLVRRLKDIKKDETIMTHCSAGIGRTGTLVAANMLFTKISSNTEINVYDTVMNLRKQRAGAVQAEIQYIYLYKIIVDYCLIINALTASRKAIAIRFVEEYNSYYESLLQGVLPPQ